MKKEKNIKEKIDNHNIKTSGIYKDIDYVYWLLGQKCSIKPRRDKEMVYTILRPNIMNIKGLYIQTFLFQAIEEEDKERKINFIAKCLRMTTDFKEDFEYKYSSLLYGEKEKEEILRIIKHIIKQLNGWIRSEKQLKEKKNIPV